MESGAWRAWGGREGGVVRAHRPHGDFWAGGGPGGGPGGGQLWNAGYEDTLVIRTSASMPVACLLFCGRLLQPLGHDGGVGVGGGRPLRACEVTERQPARLLSVRRRPCEVSGRGEANLGQQNGGDDLPLFAAPKEEDRPGKRLHTRRLTRGPRNTGVRATPRPAESPTRGPPFVGAGGGDATAPPPFSSVQQPARCRGRRSPIS